MPPAGLDFEMSNTVNKHGLSRRIPEPVARQIRQADGYGCVICGDAIYQYEHIDPEFADAESHDPAKMALLCGSCHDRVTRGLISKQTVLKAKQKPKCKSVGWSTFAADLPGRFVVELGSGFFINPIDILRIDGEKVLSISPPESSSSPPRISARFCDREGTEVGSIVDNEWRGSARAFDIACKGSRFSIRSALGQIDLAIEFSPPNGVRIESIDMKYKGVHLHGRLGSRFTIATSKGQVVLPSDSFTVENSEYCIAVISNEIRLALDDSMRFWGVGGIRPRAIVVLGGSVEFLSYDEAAASGDLEPDMKAGEKLIKVTNTDAAAKDIGFATVFPNPDNYKKSYVVPVWIKGADAGASFCAASPTLRVEDNERPKFISLQRLVGREYAPCPCGSGRHFSVCTCGRFRQ